MKWIWFNLAALIAFFSLALHGAPPLPVLAGIGAAALLNSRKRKSAAQ